MAAGCGEAAPDIESLVGADDEPTARLGVAGITVQPHARRHRRRGAGNSNTDSNDDAAHPSPSSSSSPLGVVPSHVPGTESIYVRTWGCSHNNSDSEYMAGALAAYGYSIVQQPESADLWLLNSCAVKTPSEENFNRHVREGLALGKKVVMAGCVPSGQPRRWQSEHGLSIVGVQHIDRVVEVVEETLKGNVVQLTGRRKKQPGGSRDSGPSLALPKIRRNPLIEIIPINSGCLNQCTYCKTKHARGNLQSYPPEMLLERVRSVVAEGVVEIWLTSEDTGTYGRDIGTDLPTLLWQMVELLPEGVMLRLGMTNPPYIMDHLEEMARVLAHPRVYSFLHIPVQAGSDAVLAAMRRDYTADDFCRAVDHLQRAVPGITIATDLICGFPGETDEDFADTMALVRRYRFPVLHTNQFFPRPGTPAAAMPRVPTKTVKQRTKEVSDFFRSYHPYEHKVGQRQRILVTETATDGQHYIGHNKFYEQVLVPMRDELMGKAFDVVITRTGKFFLEGEVIEETVAMAPKRPQVELRQEQSLGSVQSRRKAVSAQTLASAQRLRREEQEQGKAREEALQEGDKAVMPDGQSERSWAPHRLVFLLLALALLTEMLVTRFFLAAPQSAA